MGEIAEKQRWNGTTCGYCADFGIDPLGGVRGRLLNGIRRHALWEWHTRTRQHRRNDGRALALAAAKPYVCDQCGHYQDFVNDTAAERIGWGAVAMYGKKYVLCPAHFVELKAFLHAGSIKVRADV